ncbi:MAG: hypothetical protein JWQ35_1242 [Bacteriovoracaceae bacterium]|nr:hypothetical protein [Bacteriovoracaceae bacterium]
MFASFRFSLGISIFLNFFSTAHAIRFTSCSEWLAIQHKLLTSRSYIAPHQQRSFRQVLSLTGPRLLDDLSALNENSHLFEGGASVARALSEIVKGFETSNGLIHLKSRGVTAADVQRPNSEYIDELFNSGKQFRYLEGYVEDMPVAQVGVVDGLLDIMGPFTYTARIDLVLRRYLSYMKIGAWAYISFRAEALSINQSPNGLGQYFSEIKNVQIEWLPRIDKEVQTIRLLKTGWTTDESVPSLRLSDNYFYFDYRRDIVPFRNYYR